MKDFLRSVKKCLAITHDDANLGEIMEDENENIFSRKSRKSEQEKRLIFLAGNVCAFRNISRLKHFRKGNCYDNDKCFKSSQCQSYTSNIAHQYLKKIRDKLLVKMLFYKLDVSHCNEHILGGRKKQL
jgi:hypothetical protein